MTGIKLTLTGTNALSSSLNAMAERLAIASVAGVHAAGDAVVKDIRKEMGTPRWGHRGKSDIYSAAVKVGPQRGGSSSGPMGKFTGVYAKSWQVTTGRAGMHAFGTVKLDTEPAGNRYKMGNERKYPTFEPAALKGAATFRIACEHAWRTAL